MKHAGVIVFHFVRNPMFTIMPSYVSMVALTNTKQSKKVCQRRIDRAASFALPEHGVDAISFSYYSSLSYVIAMR